MGRKEPFGNKRNEASGQQNQKMFTLFIVRAFFLLSTLSLGSGAAAQEQAASHWMRLTRMPRQVGQSRERRATRVRLEGPIGLEAAQHHSAGNG